MMKNVCLSLIMLTMMNHTVTWAQTSSSTASTQSNQSVVLKDLNFKTVMMAFYQKQLKHIVIPELDQNKEQYVGRIPDEGVDSVLVFDPAEKFLNASQEVRYILTVSRRAIDPDSKALLYCDACSAYTDVYLFKKNADGDFQLLTHSPKSNGWWSNGTDQPLYFSKGIVEDAILIGPNQKGLITTIDVASHGESLSILYVQPLFENQPLKQIKVAQLDSSNEDSGEDKIYKTQAQYQLLKTVHDGLYDIEIKYTGAQSIESKGQNKVIPINQTYIYKFNAKQQTYLSSQFN